MEKRGRAMTAEEAQRILETTTTKTKLISWFQPFTEQMISAIESGAKSVILNGRTFLIKNYGSDYVFAVADGFVPMTRVSLKNLQSRLVDDNVSIA